MLEEAASGLFYEQGYDKTTIDQIAQRAGISRGTFFSYCQSKADVLWIQLDVALDAVTPSSERAIASAAASLIAAVEPWGDRQPWVLREAAAMGAEAALLQSSVERLLPVVERISLAIAMDEGSLPDAPRPRSIACALVAAATGAVTAWAVQTERGTASDAVRVAVEPIAAAFAR